MLNYNHWQASYRMKMFNMTVHKDIKGNYSILIIIMEYVTLKDISFRVHTHKQ